MTSKTFANNKANTYTYNPTGTLKSRTWARGITTTYTYDNFKQLLKTSYSDATPTITNTYNAMGEIKAITDIKGTTSFTYNNYGQVISESISGLYNKTLTQNYDNFGRNIGYSLDNSTKASYSYEETIGRLNMMNATNGGNFEFGYMENTNLQNKITYPNGIIKEIEYENDHNLITDISYKNDENTISNYTYENDVLGRRTNIGITYESTTKNTQYGYNPRSEVTSAINPMLNQAFSYDNIGNRITSSNNNLGTNYTTNNLNQYTSIASNSSVPSASGNIFPPTFDDDGNQTLVKTKTGIFEVTYNGENRPIKFTNISDSTYIAMLYDYMGRRIEKQVSKSGLELTHEKYVYDGYVQIQCLNKTNEVQKEYVWDPTEEVATRPLVFKISNEALYYLHDANKNVVGITNDSCMSIAYYEYDTFGNLITHISNIDNPFQFSSEYFDSELSLIYYNYRHYNPISGRWISRDPIAEKGGFNLYLTCFNNPLLYCDRLGAEAISIGISIVVLKALTEVAIIAIGSISTYIIVDKCSGKTTTMIINTATNVLNELNALLTSIESGVTEAVETAHKKLCDTLNGFVQSAKDGVGKVGKCESGMCDYELKRRLALWLAEAVARSQRDVLCPSYRDIGHDQAMAQVWGNVGTCSSLLIKNYF